MGPKNKALKNNIQTYRRDSINITMQHRPLLCTLKQRKKPVEIHGPRIGILLPILANYVEVGRGCDRISGISNLRTGSCAQGQMPVAMKLPALALGFMSRNLVG